MTVTVYYMTEAKLSKTLGERARIVDQEFQALEEAKLAAFPNGVVFGYIPVEGGYYTRRDREATWTFESDDGNPFIPGMRTYVR
jgi:hypothetical protein